MNALLITAITVGLPLILSGIGYGIYRAWVSHTDSVVAEKLAKAETAQVKETNERQANDAAIQKNTNVIVDNLSDDDVLQRLQSGWKSPKQ